MSTDDLAGKRFGIGSYGSGSSAIVCSFIVQPEYKEVVKKMNLIEKLNQRKRISIDIYEDLHEGRLKLHESVIPPKNEFTLVSLGNKSHDYGYRYYKYVK